MRRVLRAGAIGGMALRMSSFLVMVASAGVAIGFALQSVDAATYAGPSANPPAGNMPSTIWNRHGLTAGRQTGATFNIDGDGFDIVTGQGTKGVGIGSDALALSAAQNLIYGNASSSSTGKLLLLQTTAAGVPSDKFSVDVAGNVKAAGCFGSSFVGVTTTSHHGPTLGAVGNYYNADALCKTAFARSHVCRPDEILESISCWAAGDPIKTVANGTNAWINAGPPGYLADANDCSGWQSVAATATGKYWEFNQTTGGIGKQTGCNIGTGLPFACCR